ncbi:MAG TPA: pitrilysin family protein [Thermoanaerobaculia bacterium]|nr:pitrilysin family protein [Thermoanaerobaculia bacterium]
MPIVSVRVLFPGGARCETIPGQALVTGRMLAEGTRRRGWRQLAEDLEGRGMILQTSGTAESLTLGLEALASDLDRALAWAAEIALEPTFPADRCDWLARQATAELASLGDQPEVATAWRFSAQLYHPHPRQRPVLGTPEGLALVDAEACRAFHQSSVAEGAIVVVTGELEPDAVRRRIEELFALPVAAPSLPFVEPPRPVGLGSRQVVPIRTGEQAHLYLGHLTVDRRHPDYLPLELLAVILGAGAGLAGRIPGRIREQEGLAYSTFAQTTLGAGLDPGRLIAYVGTSPETAAQAERGVREELERLVEQGLGDDEVNEARAYLLGREPFRRETARQYADLLVEALFYGLPEDDLELRAKRLQELDRPSLEELARRHIRPQELKVTIGLPAAG